MLMCLKVSKGLMNFERDQVCTPFEAVFDRDMVTRKRGTENNIKDFPLYSYWLQQKYFIGLCTSQKPMQSSRLLTTYSFKKKKNLR